MEFSHSKTTGVFSYAIDAASFFDVVALHVWGKRRGTPTNHVSIGKNRAIGGNGKAYARCVPGRNRTTKNPFQFKYGVMLPYRNVSPFFVILWAGGGPVTWADATLVIDAFLQRRWRARVAWVELTFDTHGIPLELFSRELCTTARTIREFQGQHGNTLCVGSPNSAWRMKIYRKTAEIVRVEFTLQGRYLRKHGIVTPQQLCFLSKLHLWDQVSFRRVDQNQGYSLPARIREPWTWLGHGLPPSDLPPSVLLKTLREVRVDPKPYIVRSEREKLLRGMQRNLIW